MNLDPVIVCGPHGSGCTWAFNVCRELAIATFGETHTTSGMLMNPEWHPPAACKAVMKTHRLPTVPHQRLLVMTRDPRDSLLSITRRTGMGFDSAAVVVLEWWKFYHILIAETPSPPLILRYESGPHLAAPTVSHIAAWMGGEVSPALQDEIFHRYTATKVQAMSMSIIENDHAVRNHWGSKCDPVTLFHSNHVGPGLMRAYAQQPDAMQERLTEFKNRRIAPLFAANPTQFPYWPD